MLRNAMVASMLLVLLTTSAWASQAPGHGYVALRALDQAPQSVRDLCNANLDAYLAGSAGPDIALTSYLIAEYFEWDHPGAEAHYDRTGLLIMNMLQEAQKLSDQAARNAGTAFALGWLTHYCTDCVIHALVNQCGGYYGGGHDFQIRHKHLELVECEHVLRKVANPQRYVINAGAVPVELITSAFHETFPEKAIYTPIVQYTDLAYTKDLAKSAFLMSQATQFFVNVHNGDLAWRGPVFSTVFSGYPPTTDEYDLLMEPLLIDDVQYEPPNRAVGETTARIVVKYTINDFRLFSLFCRRWDQVIGTAIANAVGYFNTWGTAPAQLRIFDRNLDTGGNIGSTFDTSTAWPGNPTIESMLSFLEVRDRDGNELSGWPADGKWAPIVIVQPALAQAGQTSTGIISEGQSWNGGKAGSAFIKFPFDAGKPGPYEVKLRLAFADRASKRLYGWADQNTVVDAAWNGTLGEQNPELSICFLVDCSGSMGGSKIAAAKAAVRGAVEQTNDGKTEWCLIGFGSCSVRLHCGFTMDANELKTAVDTLQATGDTPLTYGKYKGLTYLTRNGSGKQGRLIILCDGQDNCPEHGGIRQEEAAASLHQVFQQVHEAQMRGGR